MIHGALSTTGGMFNPMLATVLVSGCKGHDLLDHISKYIDCLKSIGRVHARCSG